MANAESVQPAHNVRSRRCQRETNVEVLKTWNLGWWLPVALLATPCGPAQATVRVVSLTPELASPQPIGAIIGWTAKATDTNPGPLAFQFNVAPPGGAPATVRNFNVGRLDSGAWKSPKFSWALTGMDGTYPVQVVAKDFASGESDSQTVSFTVTSPLTGSSPVAQPTQNPLVALFIAPSCAAGSLMRVVFQPQSRSAPATPTNWAGCHPPAVMTFEIAGMYPSTVYSMHAQVRAGGTTSNGPAVSFTTGALPAGIPFPTFQAGITAAAGDPNRVILHTLFDLRQKIAYPNVATDLAGNIIWYDYASDKGHISTVTRPLANGYIATQNGPAWTPGVQTDQVLRQLDWAGNIVRETNTGIVSQQLLALGDPDAAPCNTIPSPPPAGAACLGIFNHDAIQTLPNGYTAALMDVEKIFPPGTQGDTTGLLVDVVGDIIVVLDQNWNAVWYWDAFNPNGGGNGYPQLPLSRAAVLGEACGAGCLAVFLLGPGVSRVAQDWLHGNSLYYWPHDGASPPSKAPGDLIWSSRHQDWVIKIDYKDGAGTGNILWRMGPSGDFSFNNIYNDAWPWFSHQHEAGIENGGAGPMTVFDNGNTRVSPPAGPGSSTGGLPGLGADCGPDDCNSRGIALAISESSMQVTPVMSVDLGVYSDAMGSAQLLADGNYFFQPATVVTGSTDNSFCIEIQPTPGTDSGVQVMSISGPGSYRSWQMPNLYSPPST